MTNSSDQRAFREKSNTCTVQSHSNATPCCVCCAVPVPGTIARSLNANPESRLETEAGKKKKKSVYPLHHSSAQVAVGAAHRLSLARRNGSVAVAAAPVFLGRAGKGEVNGTRWRRGGLVVLVGALLRQRAGGGFEGGADVVAERRVCQDGKALARVEG